MDIYLTEVLKWFALLVLLYLLYQLWQLINREWQKEKQQAFGGGQRSDHEVDTSPFTEDPSSSFHDQSFVEELMKRQQRQKEAQLRKILQRDPSLADDIRSLANVDETFGEIDDPKVIEEIARRLSDRTLYIFDVVSQKPVVNLDLKSQTRLEKTPTGGVYQQPRRIRGLHEFPRVRLSEWAYPKALRHRRILSGEAQTLQRYELVQDQKTLVVLEDSSGSMIENSLHGFPRFYWSRGQVVGLAREALAGKTAFFYHEFNEEALPGVSVRNPQEATRFYEWAVSGDPATGGTNIYNALKRAVKYAEGDKLLHILLISDGEDDSTRDVSKVRRLLKKGNIQLHVVVIGGSNEALKKVAASYQEIN